MSPLFAQIAKNNFMELFTHHFKNQFTDKVSLIEAIHELLSYVINTSMFRDGIQSNGVLDDWIQMSIRISDFDGINTPEERISALSFLSYLWEIQSEKINESPDISATILTMLKRGCRDRSKVLRIVSCELMFKLLTVFATERNPSAPIIYKSLTFLMIEYHVDIEIREQMMRHFIKIFTTVQTVPVSIVVEPLIKQIEISAGTSYLFNIFDFEFFRTVVLHKRSNLNICMQILQTMATIAANNMFFANSCISVILMIVNKFTKDPMLIQ